MASRYLQPSCEIIKSSVLVLGKSKSAYTKSVKFQLCLIKSTVLTSKENAGGKICVLHVVIKHKPSRKENVTYVSASESAANHFVLCRQMEYLMSSLKAKQISITVQTKLM